MVGFDNSIDWGDVGFENSVGFEIIASTGLKKLCWFGEVLACRIT